MRKSMKRRRGPGPRASSARDRPWPARGSVAMLNHLEFWAPPANQAPRGLPAKLLGIVGLQQGRIKRLGAKAAWKLLFFAFQARGEEPVHAAPFQRPEVELVGKSPQEPWGL